MRGQMIILWGFNRGVTSIRCQNSATGTIQHQIEWNCQCKINNQFCAPTSASTAQRFSSSINIIDARQKSSRAWASRCCGFQPTPLFHYKVLLASKKKVANNSVSNCLLSCLDHCPLSHCQAGTGGDHHTPPGSSGKGRSDPPSGASSWHAIIDIVGQ